MLKYGIVKHKIKIQYLNSYMFHWIRNYLSNCVENSKNIIFNGILKLFLVSEKIIFCSKIDIVLMINHIVTYNFLKVLDWCFVSINMFKYLLQSFLDNESGILGFNYLSFHEVIIQINLAFPKKRKKKLNIYIFL